MHLEITKRRISTFKFASVISSTSSSLSVITLLILALACNSTVMISFNIPAALAQQQNPSSLSIDTSSLLNNQTFSNQTYIGSELIYEAKGKIVSQELVPVVLDSAQQTGEDNDDEAGIPKIKVSYSGTGNIKGIGNITETWTFVNTHRPNGIIHGIGHGAIITLKGNEVATAIEFGRGHQQVNNDVIGEKIVYPGARFVTTDSTGKLAFLNEIVGVTQWEVDELGNYTHRIWEWK